MIKHEGDEWVLYSKDGKRILGRHKNKADAEEQERAVQARKHGEGESMSVHKRLRTVQRKRAKEASVPGYIKRKGNPKDEENWLRADAYMRRLKGNLRFSGKSWKLLFDGDQYDRHQRGKGPFRLKISDWSGLGRTDYLFELVHLDTGLKVSFKISTVQDLERTIQAQVAKHAWNR